MELRDFIKKTLVEISCGVHEARVTAKDLVSIVPDRVGGQPYKHKVDIDFDISVIVSEKKSSASGVSGKIEPKIEIFGASIGAVKTDGNYERISDNKNEQVQRINFKVPVLLNGNHRNDEGAEAEAEFVKNAVKRIKDEN